MNVEALKESVTRALKEAADDYTKPAGEIDHPQDVKDPEKKSPEGIAAQGAIAEGEKLDESPAGRSKTIADRPGSAPRSAQRAAGDKKVPFRRPKTKGDPVGSSAADPHGAKSHKPAGLNESNDRLKKQIETQKKVEKKDELFAPLDKEHLQEKYQNRYDELVARFTGKKGRI